jgi:hypothetical protein
LRTRLVLAAVVTVALAGCARTVDGSPASVFPTDITSLANKIHDGMQSLHTAHLTMRMVVAGQTVSASGDEQLSGGHETANSLSMQLSGMGTIKLLRAGGQTYVRLPAAQRTSDKPWVLVRPGSSNPFARSMASSLAGAGQLAQFGDVQTFVRATKDLRFEGTETIAAATVGHYMLTVDASRLPDDFPAKRALQAIGVGKLPIGVWVDADGRSRKITEKFPVVGLTAVVTLGAFDQPVHISAPPASQVDTS